MLSERTAKYGKSAFDPPLFKLFGKKFQSGQGDPTTDTKTLI